MSDALAPETEIPATVTVSKPDDKALDKSKVTFTDLANSIVITDQASYEKAAKFLTENKAEQDRLDKERRGFVDPLNKVVKDLNAKFKPTLDALTSAETIVKRKISTYMQEQERKQREAQAEAERIAAKERAKLEARADKAEAAGNEHKAEALRETASMVVASSPGPAVQKVAGVATRKVWKAEVTDIVKLCKLIADGVLPATMIEVKPVELNKVATQWQNTREFEGLRIYQDVGVAAGRR